MRYSILKAGTLLIAGLLCFSPVEASECSPAEWSQGEGRVVISEVYYDSYLEEYIINPGHHKGEFIELFNASCSPVNISGWTLYDANSPAFFTFPAGTIIPSKGFVIYTYGQPTDAVKFHNIFPQAAPYTAQVFYKSGPGALILNNKGEMLYLKNNSGVIKDFVGYGGRSAYGMTYNLTAVNGFNTGSNYTVQNSVQRTNVSSYYNQTDIDDEHNEWPVSLGELNTPVMFGTQIATPFGLPNPINGASYGLGPCMAVDKFFISQVYYDSYWESGASHLGEFIELYNGGDVPLDLQYYTLRSAKGDWTYKFADQLHNQYLVPPKTYVTVVAASSDFDFKTYLDAGSTDPARNAELAKILSLHPMLGSQSKYTRNKIVFTASLKLRDDADAVVLDTHPATLVDYVGYGNYRYLNLDPWPLSASNPGVAENPTSLAGSRSAVKKKASNFVKTTVCLPSYFETGKSTPLSTNDYYSNQNYISTDLLLVATQSESGLNALPKESKRSDYQYFDGLGSLKETVLRAASPTGRDLVTFSTYDRMGRQDVDYLAFAANTDDGGYKPVIDQAWKSFGVSEDGQFYQGLDDRVARSSKPFSKRVFEKSPVETAIKIGHPGEQWQPVGNVNDFTDHTRKVKLSTNTVSDQVIRFIVSYGPLGDEYENGSLERTGYFAANLLTKEIIYDEQSNGTNARTINFRDFYNRVVLRRQYTSDGVAESYFVYDHYGLLCYSIQPEGTKLLIGVSNIPEEVLSKWTFSNRYDRKNRLIESKKPGLPAEFYVYDNRNRLVLTQTGAQRAIRQWSFIKYDKMNRPIIKGLYVHNTVISQAQMSLQVSTTSFFETYNGVAATHGYSNLIFPKTNADASPLDINQVFYYDTYEFKTMLPVTLNYSATEITGQEPVESLLVRGYISGSKSKVLGVTPTTFLWASNYYDAKYRLIQSVSQNFKSGIDRVTRRYDFINVMSERTSHTVGAVTNVVAKRFEFDHQGRLKKRFHKVNSQAEVLAVENKYNELGQLITQKLHSEDNGSSYRQVMDYRYTIRGWIKRINHGDLHAESASDPADLFGMELHYDDVRPGVGNSPEYGGNVSALAYSVNAGLSETSMHGYKMKYDKMDRLTGARFVQNTMGTWASPSSFAERGIEYDFNGNMKNLRRTGENGAVIDSLKYYYNGNQLIKVEDKGDVTKGFRDGLNADNDYTYNDNGAVTSDKNRNIQSGGILYNHLNLPTRIIKGTGEKVEYVYDALGKKLSKKVYNASGVLQQTVEYAGIFTYENNALTQIHHEDGRLIKEGSSFVYQYVLKDYLGNTRLTFTTRPKSEDYKGGYEDARLTAERNIFNPSYDDVVKSSASLYNHTPSGSKSERLSAATQKEIIGLAKSLKVMPGDEVKIDVWAKYTERTTVSPTAIASLILPSIASSFGVSSSSTGEPGKIYQSLSSVFSGGAFIGNEDLEDDLAPKAFLNYILFDKDYVPYDFGFDQISQAAKETGTRVDHDRLMLTATVTKPGYIFVYISNESDRIVDVYFDDLGITHSQSPVIQTNEYYPFGLTFNNQLRENNIQNKYLFGQKELQDELDLGQYDFGVRSYMPDIARWTAVDPLAEAMPNQSLYNYSYNNPLRYNDLTGMMPSHAVQDDQKDVDVTEEYTDDHDYERQEDGSVKKVKHTYDDYDTVLEPDGSVGYYDKCGEMMYVERMLDEVVVTAEEGPSMGPWKEQPTEPEKPETDTEDASRLINPDFLRDAAAMTTTRISKRLAEEIIKQTRINNALLKKGLQFSGPHRMFYKFKFVAKWTGPVANSYEFVNTNQRWINGELTNTGMVVYQAVNGISCIPVWGTAVSIGWDAGAEWGPSKWYGNNDSKWFE
jgi:RHS repeat-associated protein